MSGSDVGGCLQTGPILEPDVTCMQLLPSMITQHELNNWSN